ncbi:MAG TPA: GAF domain-containing protein [Planctomycetota bacterium]|nr:GAF domain-containing protein [Planctomycetota bacterium]HRR82522.1 GAF domain-containing protein [Planctomycetota bacterium]HRT93386.1 GAF domain-containing protein [Planctomycetota bacterium]
MEAHSRVLQTYLGIAPRTSEEAALRLLVDLGRQYADAEEGSLLVLDPRTNELVFAMTSGDRQSEKTLLGQRVPMGRGLVGLAVATREVQAGAPTFRDLRQRKHRGAAGSQPTAVLAAPMLVREEVIGVLTAATFRPGRHFTQAHAAFYGKIAAVAGLVVDQQQRLAAVEHLDKGGRLPAARTREQRLQAEIVARVVRLTAGRPERLARVAALLAAVEALGRGPQP